MANGPLTHFGTVAFDAGEYRRTAGTANWRVEPIEGFAPSIRLPLGMIRITFSEAIADPYTPIVTAVRTPTTPMLVVGCGDLTPTGFVVNVFDPVGTRTLQNGGFSFLVLQAVTS